MKVLYRGQLLDVVKIETVRDEPLQDANGHKIEMRWPNGTITRTDMDMDPGFNEPLASKEERCDECGVPMPGEVEDAQHADSCSRNPANTVG